MIATVGSWDECVSNFLNPRYLSIWFKIQDTKGYLFTISEAREMDGFFNSEARPSQSKKPPSQLHAFLNA